MKKEKITSSWQIFKMLPQIVKGNKKLLATPVAIGVTTFVTGVVAAYHSFYKNQSEYKSTEIYKESIKHLIGYEPLAKYVGAPIYVQWVKQVTYDKNTVTLVVPFKGPKGKALLIINGRKGPNNKPVLDNLEIAVKNPPKRWTFLITHHNEGDQNNNNITDADVSNKSASSPTSEVKFDRASVSAKT